MYEKNRDAVSQYGNLSARVSAAKISDRLTGLGVMVSKYMLLQFDTALSCNNRNICDVRVPKIHQRVGYRPH
jgi:hypothetical protein